jgi:hypothetical protein
VEPGSPFGGESQAGHVPLHRIKHGLMSSPPNQIRIRWFHTFFPGNPHRGVKETSRSGLRYEA